MKGVGWVAEGGVCGEEGQTRTAVECCCASLAENVGDGRLVGRPLEWTRQVTRCGSGSGLDQQQAELVGVRFSRAQLHRQRCARAGRGGGAEMRTPLLRE